MVTESQLRKLVKEYPDEKFENFPMNIYSMVVYGWQEPKYGTFLKRLREAGIISYDESKLPNNPWVWSDRATRIIRKY